MKSLERRKKNEEQHLEYTRKLEEAEEKKATKDELTARLADPAFLLLPVDEALTKVAEMGTDAVEMFNKPVVSKATLMAARVKAIKNTEEYKTADANLQLAMLADAGDKRAGIDLAKRREREEKGKLTEQQQIDRT
jgi:hypothetical protein